MIFEAIGPYNAIGKIALAEVEAALAAGWTVTVVAKLLDESLLGRVEWRRLYVPPRGFALQWLTAGRFLRRALGDPSRFDVIHGHQPQIAALCDVFQCHFLTRVAFELDCLFDGAGARRLLDVAQKRLVLRAEDRCYRSLRPDTRVIFVSELLEREFARLYGAPPEAIVLQNAAPVPDPIALDERVAARNRYAPDAGDRIIVGFLGGLTERKGGQCLRDAIADDEELFLLLAGARSANFIDSRLKGRMSALGLISRTHDFYACCDVVAIPSVFDPCPCVVLEAASRGVPSIVTLGVGNASAAVGRGASALWDPGVAIGPVIRDLLATGEAASNASRWATDCSQAAYCESILSLYDDILRTKKLGSQAKSSLANRR